jgi:hypothetical protein
MIVVVGEADEYRYRGIRSRIEMRDIGLIRSRRGKRDKVSRE